MKSSKEIARTPLVRALSKTATVAAAATALLAIVPAHAAHTVDVVNFGGNNHQTLLDANKDAFVVDASSGQLYIYDAAHTIAPSPDRVFSNRIAPIPGVHVYGNQILDVERGVLLGEILVDQARKGQEFSILGYRMGTTKGYLDVDFNDNYRGDYIGEKSDARIKQVNALSFVKTYKGLKGKKHWFSLGTLPLKEHRKKFPMLAKTLKYTFKVPTDGKYQVVLRNFNHTKNDLDLRLVELSTGRILSASYSTKSGELVAASLKAGQQYGVVLERKSAAKSVSYTLNIKQTNDQVDVTNQPYGNLTWLPYLQTNDQRLIKGTIRSVTPYELVSRFAPITDASGDVNAGVFFDPGWDSSSDASGDASWDASGDASGDSLFTAVVNLPFFQPYPFFDIPDFDAYVFSSAHAFFNYFVSNSGGTTLNRVRNIFSDQSDQTWVGESPEGYTVEHAGSFTGVGIESYNQSDDTIEYEVLIRPSN